MYDIDNAIQEIKKLEAREEKLVAALKDISKEDDSLISDARYCNSYRDETCGYIAKTTLKELGL